MPQGAPPGTLLKYTWPSTCIKVAILSSSAIRIDRDSTPDRRPAACKAIRLEDSGMERWILHEIQILNQLNHPNIIKLYDTANADHYIFLFFQQYDASLRQYVDAHILLEESETKCIMWQILQGIRYLHSLNIAHCDIKLENILLQLVQPYPYPAVCIADFEMALYEDKTNQGYSGVCGTISYLPPEAIRALDNRDSRYRRKRGDRWSAGVILFVLIS
ncbi:kinase-like domain-containing protein [Mycena leptocephala]|nr:kinase-like domain-containing protein [Mycena leptocephala]